jgi:SAM-dependent methyltransferase
VSDLEGQTANAAQIDYWNKTAGQTWVQHQDQLDRQIEPLGLEGIKVLNPSVGEQILDVGCGCGQTSLKLAECVGPTGAVTGVDISAPMLDVARARPVSEGAGHPTFVECDAQTAKLGESVYDAVYSRFGVMFFSDPVAAFKNMHRALKPHGRLTFVCWRPFQDNLWMRLPMEAARPFLPAPTPSDPNAPGPFAFADADRVQSILTQAGFNGIGLRPFDMAIGGSSLDKTVALTFKVGPLASILREQPDLKPVIEEAVRAAVSAYQTSEGVLMPAAVWIVSATKD